MALDVYLNFNGNCRQAVEFYAEVFDAEKQGIMTFGDAPPSPDFNVPEEAKNLVIHTQMKIMGSTVMFSDVFPGMPFTPGNNISLTVVSKDMEETKSLLVKL